jgi:hypothetical protein
MLVIVLIIILVLAFGGGGGYYGSEMEDGRRPRDLRAGSGHSATLVCIRRIAPAQLKFRAVGFEDLKGGLRAPRIA